MRWHWDLNGCEPIIRDEPVFSQDVSGGASNKTINAGALLHYPWAATTANPSTATLADHAISVTAGALGICLIPAYSSSTASMATNAVGVMLNTPYTSGTCSSWNTTTGPTYAKVIINPGAVYLCEQNIDTSNDAAITSTSSTTVTIPSLVDDLDGAWVYFPLTQAGVKGSLRFLRAGASGSATMDAALTTSGDASDTAVVILPKHSNLWPLTATSDKCTSGDLTASASSVNLRVVETFIDRDGGLEIMRPEKHKHLDNLHLCKGGNGPKFYYDVCMRKHLYGNSAI